MTSYGHRVLGHCFLKLQVLPIEGLPHVTFEVVDVRYPVLSVAMSVQSGLRGQEAEMSTAGGAVSPFDTYSWIVVFVGVGPTEL